MEIEERCLVEEGNSSRRKGEDSVVEAEDAILGVSLLNDDGMGGVKGY